MTASTDIYEPARRLPVTAEFDVIVAGAGPAGVAAALSAARQGARTLLLENHGCLGGVWTAGVLCWIIDSGNKGGIMRELIDTLDARGARRAKGRNFAFDVEVMKLLLEELCLEAGVTLRLHTRVVNALCKERRLTHVVTESRSGREAFGASIFIDTTGDGELARQAGCGFDYGHPETGSAQPMSLVALVGGVQAGEIAPFVGGGVKGAKASLLSEFQKAGVEPSYTAPTLFPIREDFFGLVANHEYGVSPMDADAVTQATLRARQELNRLIGALNSLGGPWAGLRLIASGAQIGIREGRRIHGLYTVGKGDIIAGMRHEDAVCRVTFGIDVHSTNPLINKAYEKDNTIKCQHYDIPLRALIARDVDGLMMAGRCISGDFFAHSSYRVTGNAVAMGEAAGICAAQAAAMDCLPQQCPWDSIAEKLSTLAEVSLI